MQTLPCNSLGTMGSKAKILSKVFLFTGMIRGVLEAPENVTWILGNLCMHCVTWLSNFTSLMNFTSLRYETWITLFTLEVLHEFSWGGSLFKKQTVFYLSLDFFTCLYHYHTFTYSLSLHHSFILLLPLPGKPTYPNPRYAFLLGFFFPMESNLCCLFGLWLILFIQSYMGLV